MDFKRFFCNIIGIAVMGYLIYLFYVNIPDFHIFNIPFGFLLKNGVLICFIIASMMLIFTSLTPISDKKVYGG